MGTFACAGSLAVSSSGFTATEAGRSVEVDVVGDPAAYLGLRYPDADGDAEPQSVAVTDGRADLLYATNQFGVDVTSFEVAVVAGDDSGLRLEHDSSIQTGEADQVAVVADCSGGSNDRELTVEIRAAGDGFDAIAERTIPVTVACEGE